MLSSTSRKKKEQLKGKISIHEFEGNYFITLDMHREPGKAEMFFIFEWLLRPWIGRNVIIDIREEDSEKENPSVEPISTQIEWAKKFRKIGVV